jgi:hypothetical protein
MSDCPHQKQWDGKYTDTFCSNCWRHERFFSGGGSWSPDLCACGCEDTNVWYKMGPIQRMKARKKYKEDYELWLRRRKQ